MMTTLVVLVQSYHGLLHFRSVKWSGSVRISLEARISCPRGRNKSVSPSLPGTCVTPGANSYSSRDNRSGLLVSYSGSRL